MSPCSDDSFLFQAGGVDRCLNQIYSIYLDSWCHVWPRLRAEGGTKALASPGQDDAARVWSGPTRALLFTAEVVCSLTLNSCENRAGWKLDWRQSWGQTAKHEAPKRKSARIKKWNGNNTHYRGVGDLDAMKHISGSLSRKCDSGKMPKERNSSCSSASPDEPFHCLAQLTARR